MLRGSIIGDYTVDFFRCRGLLDYYITEKFHIYSGVVLSHGFTEYFDNEGLYPGLEFGVFYQVWKLELGVEPALIFSDNKVSLTSSVLIIRIPLSKW